MHVRNQGSALKCLAEKEGHAERVYVGGLVQDEEGGRHEEGARQGNAHAPATGEIRCALALHLVVETQPVQEARRPGLCRV